MTYRLAIHTQHTSNADVKRYLKSPLKYAPYMISAVNATYSSNSKTVKTHSSKFNVKICFS